MTAAEGNPVAQDIPVTATGIPIRNLWYMLLYAWNELRTKDHWKIEVEKAPSLDALLATILEAVVEQRLRIGLGRDYINEESPIAGIRGRVDFAESLTRLAFQHGRAYCRYQIYSPNVPRNQIVRSTLARLVQVGEFGPVRSRADALRQRLRRRVRGLDMVDLVDLKPAFIRRQQAQRHDPDYRLMLAICGLVAQRQMPTESAGLHKLPGLDRDAMVLWRVFERFVANFLLAKLAGWTVTPQKTLRWHETRTSVYLPLMKPDLVLQHRDSGRLTILDTKFTGRVFTIGRWENLTFHRDHLFQMYAYLRSQEHLSPSLGRAEGLLLYPTVRYSVSDSVEMHGHVIRWETIDLSLPWEDLDKKLLEIATNAVAPMA